MALQDVSLAYLFGVKPERAIEYLEEKGMKITFDWHEMLDDAHNRAFTVAKSLKADILQDLRDAVTETMDHGLTYQDFKKNLEPTLRAKGWWGRKEVLNRETGELREAQLGSPARLQLIYEQNVQTIYSAGRYRSQREMVASRPWWMYLAVLDARTRPEHRALHGRIFRHDDPIWEHFYPPIDWRCRCRVRALDEPGVIEMEKNGEGIWEKAGSGEALGSRQEKLPEGKETTVATYRTTDPVSGKRVTVVTGAGFNHVPGQLPPIDPGKYDPPLRKYL